jgi:hypothetical protein
MTRENEEHDKPENHCSDDACNCWNEPPGAIRMGCMGLGRNVWCPTINWHATLIAEGIAVNNWVAIGANHITNVL